MKHQASASSPRVLRAEVVLGCEDVNSTLSFFVERLGFQVQAISPADSPTLCILEGYGVRLRLEQGSGLSPGTLRLECAESEAGPRAWTAPNGTRVLLVPASQGYVLPPLEPAFVLARLADAEWSAGRAGMRYRDLIPGRLGGRFIASQIRVEAAGEVADYVHFHRVRFQMIYCTKGWARLVYEDQGEPFLLSAGDCVLQPPEIRHRVLESSAGLEVIEIGCPAEHETRGDSALQLPTDVLRPEREFEGQRFLRHQASGAAWHPWHVPGFEAREIGMQAATRGLAGAQVLRAAGSVRAEFESHNAELHFLYVLGGGLGLERQGSERLELVAGDACVIPGALQHRFDAAEEGCELLQVSLPGQLEYRRPG